MKCEGSKYAVRIETRPDISWFGECMDDITRQLKRKQRTSGSDPLMLETASMQDFDVGSLAG